MAVASSLVMLTSPLVYQTRGAGTTVVAAVVRVVATAVATAVVVVVVAVVAVVSVVAVVVTAEDTVVVLTDEVAAGVSDVLQSQPLITITAANRRANHRFIVTPPFGLSYHGKRNKASRTACLV